MRHLSAGAAALTLLIAAGSADAAPGDLDPAWGTAGITTVASNATPADVAVRDGAVVVAGTEQVIADGAATRSPVVARLDTDGKLDRAFSGDGILKLQDGGTGEAIAFGPDGKLLLAGIGPGGLTVRRLTAAGAIDTTFGQTGRVQLTSAEPFFGFGWRRVQDLVVAPDGKLLLHVTVATNDATGFPAENPGVLLRLLPNGAIDTTFGNSDQAPWSEQRGAAIGAFAPFTRRREVRFVHVAADGRLHGIGRQKFDQLELGSLPIVQRFSAAGLPDTAYGAAGTAVGEATGASPPAGFFVEANGAVTVAGGSFQRGATIQTDDGNPYLQRFTPSGTPDTSFGPQGIVRADLAPGATARFDPLVALRRDGRTIFVGDTSGTAVLARLTSANAVDPSFGPAAATAPYGPNVVVEPALRLPAAAALEGPDGLVVASGGSTGARYVVGRYQLECLFLAGCTLQVVQTGASVTLTTSLLRVAPIGIRVRRVVGKRLVLVGRVPFGRNPRGRRVIRWDKRVAGRRLRPGRYEITMRAFDARGRIAELSRPVRVRIR